MAAGGNVTFDITVNCDSSNGCAYDTITAVRYSAQYPPTRRIARPLTPLPCYLLVTFLAPFFECALLLFPFFLCWRLSLCPAGFKSLGKALPQLTFTAAGRNAAQAAPALMFPSLPMLAGAVRCTHSSSKQRLPTKTPRLKPLYRYGLAPATTTPPALHGKLRQ